MRRRLSLGLLALTALGIVRGAVPGPGDAAPPPEQAVESAALGALREDAGPWLGRRLQVVVQFHSERAAWNPWLTRFGPVDYAGFACWSDDRFTWDRAVWSDPFQHLFARRGSPAEAALRGARLYERYELVVVLREVFLGEPWVEVESARRLEEVVGEGTVLHASRALVLMAEGRWTLARGELERAETEELPAHARAELDRLREEIDAALREAEEEDQRKRS